MTDQIVFFQRKDHVRESSQHVLTATFRDRETVDNVTPTNVRYRIDCLTTCTQILDWTVATPGESVEITITPTQNALQDQCNSREVRQVTVAADYGMPSQYLDSVTFELENVRGVS